MIHVNRKINKRFSSGILISALLTGAALYLLFTGTRSIAGNTQAKQLEILTQAVRRAAVQCYAIEGRYPPSVEYLEEHYGLSIDREKYHVFYDGWASNIMPEITIIPAGEEEITWQ